jgi:hypothetical protein
MSDVAVVILNFNGRSLLDACLQSVKRLTTPADIVVADNGSSDGSVEHLREHFPGVGVLALEKNWGFAEGYNRALAAVTRPWVILLNNDAALEPDWADVLLSTAGQERRAAILGGKLLFSGLDRPGQVVQSAGARFTDVGAAFEIGWGEPDRGQHDRPAPVGSIPGAAMLVKRSVFAELGGFDQRYFAYLEDVDLCWRAWLAGHEVHYVPQAVAHHRYGQSGGGRASPFRIRWMERNRLANMFKHLEPASLARANVLSGAYAAYRLLEFASGGRWRAAQALLAGQLAFCRDLPFILQQRARIQRTRKLSDQALRDKGLLAPAEAALREYRRLSRVSLSAQAA